MNTLSTFSRRTIVARMSDTHFITAEVSQIRSSLQLLVGDVGFRRTIWNREGVFYGFERCCDRRAKSSFDRSPPPPNMIKSYSLQFFFLRHGIPLLTEYTS